MATSGDPPLYNARGEGEALQVVVFGAGAVGLGLASALLAGGAGIGIVARAATADALRRRGLMRSGLFGPHRAPPGSFAVAEQVDALPTGTADFVLVATKAFGTEVAAEALAAAPQVIGSHTRFVLCQNGWGSAERFAIHLPRKRVFSARVITGFRRKASHEVEITVHAEPIHVGSLFGASCDEVEPLCSAIAAGGIACVPSQQIAEDLWAKLLYNATLNPLGAIVNVNYGALDDSPHTRRVMEAIAHETFAAMRAGGFRTHWPSADAWLSDFRERLLPPTAAHESSMLQDLRAGRRTEIEAITGAVVELAARHGIDVPVSRSLLELVRFLERRQPLGASDEPAPKAER
jgi:2-dehydropantoate 2-reductase